MKPKTENILFWIMIGVGIVFFLVGFYFMLFQSELLTGIKTVKYGSKTECFELKENLEVEGYECDSCVAVIVTPLSRTNELACVHESRVSL